MHINTTSTRAMDNYSGNERLVGADTIHLRISWRVDCTTVGWLAL